MQIVRLNCAFSRNLGRGDDVDGLGAIMRGILKAKAAVFSGRATTELDLFGYQIEIGVSGDFLSAGINGKIGYFIDEGFVCEGGISLGAGAGFIFRVKPPQ